MYLEALSDDEEVPFHIDTPTPGDDSAGGVGPKIRKVDTGADVLDINAMRAELEKAREARKGGGG